AELLLSSHERALQPADAARAHQRQRTDQPAADDTVGLSLCVDRGRRIELEGTSHSCGRALADEDLARRGRLLEPRGDVDCIAGDERAALSRPAADHLT